MCIVPFINSMHKSQTLQNHFVGSPRVEVLNKNGYYNIILNRNSYNSKLKILFPMFFIICMGVYVLARDIILIWYNIPLHTIHVIN